MERLRRSKRLANKLETLKNVNSVKNVKTSIGKTNVKTSIGKTSINKTSIKKSSRNKKPHTIGNIFAIPNQKKLKNELINWNEWVAATDTKNYLMDDGFLDVLKNKSSSIIKANPNYSREIGNMIGQSSNNTSFVSSLMSHGNLFESKVIDLLKKELGEKNCLNVAGNFNPRSLAKYEETVNAIKKGVPVIFQGVLRNYQNKTYGVVDILIRSDWINKFLDVNALSLDESVIPAPGLKKKFHYVVVDIKYKCLPLRSDGIHLRNDNNLKAYKSQLCVYNRALEEVQGYLPDYAFILGSKWKYTSKSQIFEGNNCFERLGRIDYLNLDNDYLEKTDKAIEWIRDVRENDYDLSKYPLPRDELYPNMCNRHDFPYHEIKRKFAENNKDLTLLWNVGPKQRRIANKNGVYTWDDKNCSPETLGVKGEVKSKVLRRILEANHSETKTIYPKYIQNNIYDWKNLDCRKIELFVDFETSCSVFNQMENLLENEAANTIFLIGAGYIHPESGEWCFQKFVVDEISEREEIRICKEFETFIKNLSKSFGVEDINVWHFSQAEVVSWKHFEERDGIEHPVEWSDLLKVFLKEPIGIKGCLNYSLKEITKNFYKHGFIKTNYGDCECANGADAAVGAYRADLECKKNGTSFADHELTSEIVKYNEVDCKVLMEILYYLRENHVDNGENENVSEENEDNEEESEEEIKPVKKRRTKK